MTGYSNNLPFTDLIALVKGKLEGSDPGKSFVFQQLSLRSGSDILKKGGDVTMNYTERTYSITADNKRLFDISGVPAANCPSNAFTTADQAMLHKTVGELGKARYSQSSPTSPVTGAKKSDAYTKILLRQFIRCLFSQEATAIFGEEIVASRVVFHDYVKRLGYRVSLNYISQQKANKYLPNSVPRMETTIDLMSRIKDIFPNLDESRFWRR